MKRKKTIGAALLLACLMAMPAQAQQSPEMAYTAEQWAKLRDNHLEYEEIAQLIHEYNTTVLQNAISFKDYKGVTSSDIAENYYEAADRIAENMNYPDEDSMNYAGGVVSYLNSQIQYENMLRQADTNTNDEQTYKLKYDQQEAQLVRQAQQLLIDYRKAEANLKTYENNIVQAEANLASVQRKIAAGTALSTAEATAQQSLTTARTTLENAKVQLAGTKEQLCLMCGWKYGDAVAIGEVPEVTEEMLAALNVAADTEKALANSYSLKMTNRQLTNAQNTSVKEQLTNTKATTEQNIRKNISDLYAKINSAATELQSAQEALAVKEAARGTADRKKAAGMMTETDYNAAIMAVESAAAQVEQKKLGLRSAYDNYMSAVNGLAEG